MTSGDEQPIYRIERLDFAAGAGPRYSPTSITVSPVTLLVGPNNAGKSTALREIESYSRGGDSARRIFSHVEMRTPRDPEGIARLLRRFEWPVPDRQLENQQRSARSVDDNPEQRFQVYRFDTRNMRGEVVNYDMETFPRWLTNPQTSLQGILGIPYTLRIDGRSRFLLVDPQPTGDLRRPPQNHLWYLAINDEARNQVREITAEALGFHFVIDATEMQSFRIRLSRRAPVSRVEELGLGEESVQFHSQAIDIGEFGDGVQAFVGIVAAVIGLPHTVILVDEPEAYLSPPLSRIVGRVLAEAAVQRQGTLVVATHSADIVAGCLEVAPMSSLVRLTNDQDTRTATRADPVDVAALMRDPLFRSAGIVQALFHRAVVITEADGDRSFYDEINRRLLDENRGTRDTLFVGVQSLQIMHRAIRPLRQLGVPTAVIVDLDVIGEPATNWERLLDGCQVPSEIRREIDNWRHELTNTLISLPAADGVSATKRGGIRSLSKELQEQHMDVLSKLARYGLFLVPNGELESWLSDLQIRSSKREWLGRVFEAIGQSKDDDHYRRAGTDDVWAFVDEISNWIASWPQSTGTVSEPIMNKEGEPLE